MPITLQVIESPDENLLLGTDWFKRTKAVLNFDEGKLRFKYLTKAASVPITYYDNSSFELDEDPDTSMDELIDVIEDLTNNDQYEDEYLNERDIFYLHSEENTSDESEESFDFDETELFANPWKNNPAVFLAQAEKENVEISEWNIKEDLHVGPLEISQQEIFDQFIEDNKDICALSQTKIGHTTLFQHQIPTGDHEPVASPAYRLKDPAKLNFLQSEIKRMEENDIIQKSKSPWASPVVIVSKKTGDSRICIDYRKLNSITKGDAYPLPLIDDLLEKFRNASWFSTLDLASGYWQVEMEETDREKTAFICQYGLYEFKRMPFGLKNAPGTFQRLMNYVLQEYLYKFVAVYLDDIIIYSTTYEEHIKHLQLVLDAIRKAKLMIKLKKGQFCLPNLPFLGHIIGRNSLQPDPKKIKKIKELPAPQGLTELRAALGLFSYYRKFVKGFSQLAKPLTILLKKDTPYN